MKSEYLLFKNKKGEVVSAAKKTEQKIKAGTMTFHIFVTGAEEPVSVSEDEFTQEKEKLIKAKKN